MPKGSIHFTGTNFDIRRRLRYDILDRMTKLIKNGTYERPNWMCWVQRHPPLSTRNILNSDSTLKNPYKPLIYSLLKKYPHLRLEGCYDPSNEFQKGFDNYKNDHPVMQFVSCQIKYMNKGYSRDQAFKMAEKYFYKKRIETEKRQKVLIALGVDDYVTPLYSNGFSYYNEKISSDKARHLLHIRNQLRKLKELALNRNKPDGTNK